METTAFFFKCSKCHCLGVVYLFISGPGESKQTVFKASLVLCVQNVMHIIQIKNASLKPSNFYERPNIWTS